MKTRTLMKSFFLGRTMLLCAVLLFAAAISNAQTVTFAQFNERFGGQDFIFNNNGGSATFQTTTGGSPVSFSYLNIPGLPIELQGGQNARVFFSSTTTAAAQSTAGNRSNQPFNNVFNILIIRDIPASVGTGNRTNLLTITVTPIGASNAELSGDEGASSAGFSASTPVQNVTFTSDFLSFNDTTQRNLTLGFSSVTPSYMLGGGTFINSFTAAGTGTFATNPAPLFTPPTAATINVSGRVLTPKGRGLANARVTLTDSVGKSITTMTDANGYYEFRDVESGETVILNVKSKLYAYAPQILNLTEESSGFNFSPTYTIERTR